VCLVVTTPLLKIKTGTASINIAAARYNLVVSHYLFKSKVVLSLFFNLLQSLKKIYGIAPLIIRDIFKLKSTVNQTNTVAFLNQEVGNSSSETPGVLDTPLNTNNPSLHNECVGHSKALEDTPSRNRGKGVSQQASNEVEVNDEDPQAYNQMGDVPRTPEHQGGT